MLDPKTLPRRRAVLQCYNLNPSSSGWYCSLVWEVYARAMADPNDVWMTPRVTSVRNKVTQPGLVDDMRTWITRWAREMTKSRTKVQGPRALTTDIVTKRAVLRTPWASGETVWNTYTDPPSVSSKAVRTVAVKCAQ